MAHVADHLFTGRVAEANVVAEILVPALLKPPGGADWHSVFLSQDMACGYAIVQAGTNCLGVIDMVTVCETGDYRDGRATIGALEPHHNDIYDHSEQILGVADPILVNDHTMAGATLMAGKRPDDLNILDRVQDSSLRNPVKCPDFCRCLLIKCIL